MPPRDCQTGWWQDIGVLLKGGWFSRWKENRHLCASEIWNQVATAYAVCFILAAFSAAITQQVLLSITLPLLITTIFLLPDFWSLSVSNNESSQQDSSFNYNVKFKELRFQDQLDDVSKDDRMTNLYYESKDRGYDGEWNLGNGTYNSNYTGGGAIKRTTGSGSTSSGTGRATSGSASASSGSASASSGSASATSGSASATSGSASASTAHFVNFLKENFMGDGSYNQRASRPEGFVDSPAGAPSGKQMGCLEPALTLPNAKNPFMNVSPDEVKYNPFRPPAADVDDPDVKKYLDKFFRVQWFSDPTDVFGKSQSQRQFITQPSTSIPNDRLSYQNWLYKLPFKTCKEGNSEVCVPGSAGGSVPWLHVNNY